MSELAPAAADAVRVVVGLGTVVVLPLGLRLLGDRAVPRSASPLWPLVGLLAAVSVWLPVGPAAAALALPFAAASVVLAGCVLRVRLLSTAVALATPLVGALALVVERAGWGLLGFSGDYLALTVPHMLFAGFGACLVVGLVAHATAGRLTRVSATAAPAGVLLVLVGYVVSDAAELVGAAVLTLGLWCAAAATVGLTGSRSTRVLLRVGAATIVASMLLALWWALGEATGIAHPSLSWMAATHGVANALGFVLCTLLGLRLRGPIPEPTGLTYPGVGATQGGPLPAGYRHLRIRHLLGPGSRPDDLARVGDALLRWRVHAAAGIELLHDADAAAPGVRVASRLGIGPVRLHEPCEVVWVERTADRVGFGYGTVSGHLFRGEEAFTVERDAAGDLWFVVTAYSVPDLWWVRAVGPLTVVGQRAYLRLLARGARRVLAADRRAVGSVA
ncbi:YndJ family transporter [Cellulomonas sp. Root137]|uniref:YndJ family transporter n=1 Tax=Cellulomonas sp. Root137 TaxID=1736459 RepID=UPI0009ECB007|nr:YndJ family transporter [Cellulomonas sp. Root137]